MLPIFRDDPHLCAHESNIMRRINAFRGWKEQFRKNEGGVRQFAEGYNTFGFQRCEAEQKWTFTEWLPEAREVFLIGDFNNWDNTHPLMPGEFGRWTVDLPDVDGQWAVPHRSQFRLRIHSEHGIVERVPAWTKLAWQNLDVGVFNGVMWEPPPSERYEMKHGRPRRPGSLKIYEAHLGLAGPDEGIHTYLEFKEVLPRIKHLGYNALQVMAVAEHDSQSSSGYEVTSFFAPSSRFGTPEELKELVDSAHGYGLVVLLDLVHSHCSSNETDGIAAMDGTDRCYTHGREGKQDQWHASLFDYGKYEVLRFLLSNIRWWIEEYGFDGFRFGGVTSMLYHSHGIGKHFDGQDYNQYFGADADTESGTYLMLANYLVKRLLPKSGVTIAEDISSMPTLCLAVDDGGFGFDYNLLGNFSSGMQQEQPDETWNISRVVKPVQKRVKEPVNIHPESSDQDSKLQEADLEWLHGVRQVPLQDSRAKQPEPEPQNEVPRRHSKEDVCDFLTLLPSDQALVEKPTAPAPAVQRQLPAVPQLGCFEERKGSISLLPDLSLEASETTDSKQGDPQVPAVSAEPSQDSKTSHRRRRRRSRKERTGPSLSWQRKETPEDQALQAAEQAARAEEERVAEAVRKAWEEEQAYQMSNIKKGSMSLLPDLSVEASETNGSKQGDHQAPVSAEPSQDGHGTGRHRRRRRRRSCQEPKTRSLSWQRKETPDDLEAEHSRAEEERAARIKALEEKQASVKRALAEAQAARIKMEEEEAEMRRQQEQEQRARLMQAQRKALSLVSEPVEAAKPAVAAPPTPSIPTTGQAAKPAVAAPPTPSIPTTGQVVVSKGRVRQVAQPKFALRAPQARSSKSLPPKKQVSEYEPVQAINSISHTRQAPQVHARLMEEPPMLNYSGRQGSLSLLPDVVKPQEYCTAAWPDRMEAEKTDLPQDEVQEASNLSLTDWAEAHHGDQLSRKEGHTTPTSGTQTPRTKAVSEPNSDSGPEMMERVWSISALDSILQDPEGKADLRHQLERDELEDRRPKYGSRHLDRPVVVVSSEVNPWSKTGGLAMVAGSYGYEFAMRGHRTMVVSPRYAAYDGATYMGYSKIWLDGNEHEVQFFHLYQDLGDGNGTDYIFVGHDCFMRGGLYCDPHTGKEYPDNLFRFSLLTVAALEAPLVLNIRGQTFGQDVLFIANDWQTGLLPVYHLYKYRRNNTYRNSRCVFVIHNIGYQGKYRLSKYPIDSYLGLPPEAIEYLQGEDLNLHQDCMNLMSAAILTSDRVLTVSPNYAKEIQSPEGGQGLHEILMHKGQQQRMAGILNGIADEWNPRTDPHIPTNYSIRDFEQGKALCKRELQKSLGLHEDPGAALIGFCGRLCFQKGVHLITEIIPWLLTYESSGVLGRVQIIMMGKGEDTYATQLANAEGCNKGRVCGYVGFDPKIEHRMLAGCDFLMMPSQYEPCGLPQMYAQAYGTVPVVHETGGLKDSVAGLWDERRDRETATGFLFCGFDENHLKERMYQALEVYHKKQDLFKQIQLNGLQKNYYWPQAIDEYERQLDWTLDSDAATS